ncbi:hypothetical protein CAter282_2847 [Collimonas arenae]|uniref:Uncharacterized protein n=1 Tax=Collimonas arenae TaxID=279058 RepID=A0A127QKI7_9BURK|nr:hypothetical protein CAter10_3137 [Collimonas arenae]AMP10571.1 hypothetical protein CAter282_2847 [Collimonas arenae]
MGYLTISRVYFTKNYLLIAPHWRGLHYIDRRAFVVFMRQMIGL